MEKAQFICESIEEPFLTALYERENRIYGLQITNNMIFSFDIQDKVMRYTGKIPGICMQNEKAFNSVVQYKNLIFFIPFWETDLILYDCETECWKKIDLKLCKEFEVSEESRQREISNNKPGRFYGGCIYCNALFLFPFGYRNLIKYEIDTGCVTHCVDFNKTILKEDVALFHNFTWWDDKHIVLSCFYSNHVVIINLENNKIEIKEIGKKEYRFSDIIKYEGVYWLVVKNKLAFVRWDPKLDCQEEYIIFPAGCEIANDKHCFDDSNIYQYGDFLYCFPASCNMAVRLDLTNGVVKEIDSLKKYCQNKQLNRRWSTFDGGIRLEDRIYLHYQLSGILVFDLHTEKVEFYNRKITDMDSIRRMKRDSFEFFGEVLHDGETENPVQRECTVGKEIDDAISELIL